MLNPIARVAWVDMMSCYFPRIQIASESSWNSKRSNALTKWAQKQRLMLQSCKSKKKDMPKNSSIGAFVAFCILDLLSKEKKFLSVTNLETSEFFPKGAGL